jgi:outer membrane protein OmpA-like peptidoglycan-associated protein
MPMTYTLNQTQDDVGSLEPIVVVNYELVDGEVVWESSPAADVHNLGRFNVRGIGRGDHGRASFTFSFSGGSINGATGTGSIAPDGIGFSHTTPQRNTPAPEQTVNFTIWIDNPHHAATTGGTAGTAGTQNNNNAQAGGGGGGGGGNANAQGGQGGAGGAGGAGGQGGNAQGGNAQGGNAQGGNSSNNITVNVGQQPGAQPTPPTARPMTFAVADHTFTFTNEDDQRLDQGAQDMPETTELRNWLLAALGDDALVQALRDGHAHFSIIGETSTTGTVEHNEHLSRTRAHVVSNVVMAQLLDRQIEGRSRVIYEDGIGTGGAYGGDQQARAQYRRVTIGVRPGPAQP